MRSISKDRLRGGKSMRVFREAETKGRRLWAGTFNPCGLKRVRGTISGTWGSQVVEKIL